MLRRLPTLPCTGATMRTVLTGIAAAAAMALGASAAQAATVLNVDWNAGCNKATCFNDDGVFTQTFSKGAFTGPVSIGQLLMDRGVLGSLDDKTFRLSFQLNGEEVGTWGSYNMGGIGGDELWFGGEQFVWNPEDGDLVLVLALVPPPKEGAGGFGGLALNTVEDLLPEDGLTDFDQGQTDIDDGGREQATAVPEPATWAMMIAGFGLAGASMRRRRAALVA